MRKIAIILLLILFMLATAACAEAAKAVIAYDVYTKAAAAMENVKSLAADTNMTITMNMDGQDVEIVMSGFIKAVTISETEVEMHMDMNTTVMGQDIKLNAYYKDGIYYMDSEGQKFSMEMPLDQIQRQANVEALSFPDTAIKNQQITKVEGGNELSFTLDGAALTDAIAAQMGDLSAMLGEGADMALGDIDYVVFIDGQGNLKNTKMSFSMDMNMLGATMPFSAIINMEYVQINNVTIDFPDDLSSYDSMGIVF